MKLTERNKYLIKLQMIYLLYVTRMIIDKIIGTY